VDACHSVGLHQPLDDHLPWAARACWGTGCSAPLDVVEADAPHRRRPRRHSRQLLRDLSSSWTETSGFDWTFERLTVSINVLLPNGIRRHFWFAAPERQSSRRWRNDPTTVVRRLRAVRADAIGEPAPPADLDEIDDALAAAEAGDRTSIDRLVDAKRLDPYLADALLQPAPSQNESTIEHPRSGNVP
jgi:hypothetical protein